MCSVELLSKRVGRKRGTTHTHTHTHTQGRGEKLGVGGRGRGRKGKKGGVKEEVRK